MQNTSHAVMAQRTELRNSLDDFPTPPWATRALIEHVIVGTHTLGSMTCLEPACGRGHMSVALTHYFRKVSSFDVFDYGFGGIADFLKIKHADQSYDWVITNPPFRLGEAFIERSMKIARRGVAMLTRTVFIESVGRYERLFKPNPLSRFAQFIGAYLLTARVKALDGPGSELSAWTARSLASIAEQQGIRIPSFLGYMGWAGIVMLPVFALTAVLFFT